MKYHGNTHDKRLSPHACYLTLYKENEMVWLNDINIMLYIEMDFNEKIGTNLY